LVGNATAKSRLASLWRLMVRWYAVMAIVFLIVFAVAGWLVFGSQGGDGWQYPWAWTVVATVASFLTLPGLTIVRGTGRVAEAARFQLIQAVVTNVVTWTALACYFGLFSAPLGNSVGLMVLALWLAFRWRPMFADLRMLPRDGPAVNWWKEIWPFQWRIAVGWPFGYLVYQLFNPVLFRLRGPEEAGRMGISLSVCTVLVGVSMTWINTKLPAFGQLIARRDWDGLDAMFWTAFRRSTQIAVACGIAGWLIIAVLQWYWPRYGDRFLPLGWMALLIANAVVTHVINALSAYVRAHRQEPFLPSIVVMGIAMAVMTVVCGSLWGYAGMTVGFVILNSLFMIRTAMIFWQSRLAWHGA
jgi:O-antigen/teichoic acid export membrane protein